MNELVNLGGSLGTRYALLFTPKFGEPLSARSLAQKLAGTVLITIGVVLVNR